MRKEFLKELMEDEGDTTSADGDGIPDTGQTNQPAQPTGDSASEEDPPEIQEPLPQGEELKKYMQRFLFFINGIRVLIKSTKDRNDKIIKAINADDDFPNIGSNEAANPLQNPPPVAAPEPAPAPEEPSGDSSGEPSTELEESLNLREEDTDSAPAEEPSEPTVPSASSLNEKSITDAINEAAAEQLVKPLVNKLETLVNMAAGTANPYAIAASVALRFGGKNLLTDAGTKITSSATKLIIDPIVKTLNLDKMQAANPELFNRMVAAAQAETLKQFVKENYFEILKTIVVSTEAGKAVIAEIAKIDILGIPVGGIALDLMGFNEVTAISTELQTAESGAKQQYASALRQADYSKEKIQDLIKARKVVTDYFEKYKRIDSAINNSKDILDDIARAVKEYYDQKLKEDDKPFGLNLDKIIKFMNNVDANKIKDSGDDVVYDNGPKFTELVKFYNTLKLNRKRQDILIDAVKGFLETDQDEESSGVGGMGLSAANEKRGQADGQAAEERGIAIDNQMINKLQASGAFEDKDKEYIKSVISLVDSIKKEALEESLNEGWISDLKDELMNWAFGRDYDELYKNPNSEPVVKTEKDLAKYDKFMEKNKKVELEPENASDSGETNVTDTVSADAPAPPSAKRDDIFEENGTDENTIPKFFEKTKFIISDKLYSTSVYIQTKSIADNVKTYSDLPDNQSFTKLLQIANLVMNSLGDYRNRFDISKIFKQDIKIPEGITEDMIKEIVTYVPEEVTNESLIRKLVRQEVKQHMKIRIKESLRLQKGPLSQGLIRKLSSLDEEFEDYYNRFLTIYNKMRQLPDNVKTDSNTDQLAIDFVTNLFADLNRPLNEEDMPIPKWRDIDERYEMLYSEFEKLIDLEDNFDEAKAKESINFFKREYQKFLTMLSSIAQSGKIGDQTLKLNEVKRLIIQELKVLNGKKMVRN